MDNVGLGFLFSIGGIDLGQGAGILNCIALGVDKVEACCSDQGRNAFFHAAVFYGDDRSFRICRCR